MRAYMPKSLILLLTGFIAIVGAMVFNTTSILAAPSAHSRHQLT